jgi:hypothetical protein
VFAYRVRTLNGTAPSSRAAFLDIPVRHDVQTHDVPRRPFQAGNGLVKFPFRLVGNTCPLTRQLITGRQANASNI